MCHYPHMGCTMELGIKNIYRKISLMGVCMYDLKVLPCNRQQISFSATWVSREWFKAYASSHTVYQTLRKSESIPSQTLNVTHDRLVVYSLCIVSCLWL